MGQTLRVEPIEGKRDRAQSTPPAAEISRKDLGGRLPGKQCTYTRGVRHFLAGAAQRHPGADLQHQRRQGDSEVALSGVARQVSRPIQREQLRQRPRCD